jgi:site-specific recombinase XerC
MLRPITTASSGNDGHRPPVRCDPRGDRGEGRRHEAGLARTSLTGGCGLLLVDDLCALLGALRPQISAQVRDAALLAIGWAAALRRSKIVGLDWQKLGSGSGFVPLNERGVVVTLMASKASQDQAEKIVMPCADMPAACQAVQRWADLAQLAPGQPVFRPVDQRQIIGEERLTDRSVARIIKGRVHKLARLRGKSETEADELVVLFSGHSLHAGYATSAAARDMPGC